MPTPVQIWHNPRCSKSRKALEILQETGAVVDVRLYLEEPASKDELRTLAMALGDNASSMLRSTEPEFAAVGMGKNVGDMPLDSIIAAIAKVPKLLQRPIVVVGTKVVIARPPELALTVLKE